MIDLIRDPQTTPGPTIIDITDPSSDDMAVLKERFGLPPELVHDCLQPFHLPKLETAGGATFLLVRAYDDMCHATDDGVQSMTRKLVLFMDERFLVAIHRQELPFLRRILEPYRATREAPPLANLTLEILLAAVETYHKPLEQAELRIHEYEVKMFKSASSRKDWEDIFVTKSRLMVIKRMLWHILNAVQKYVPGKGSNWPGYQDLTERIESLQFFTDSLLDNLNNLLSIQISLASNSTNEVMRILTLFSAVFMPLTFIVGIYGMNFEHMPELKSPYGYLGVWAVLVATAAGIYFWFRRRGWIQ